MNKVKKIICLLLATVFIIPTGYCKKVEANELNKYITYLPTKGIKCDIPLSPDVMTSEKAGDAYMTVAYKEVYNTNGTVMQNFKKLTNEVIKNQKTDYDKAHAIEQYVCSRMTYVEHGFFHYDLKTIYKYWEGKCSDYAYVTAAMLYWAGIPNAYFITESHAFNLALCDGRWIAIDSQGYFDFNPDSENYPLNDEVFRFIMLNQDGYIYVVNKNAKGLLFAGAAGKDTYGLYNLPSSKKFTIPSFVIGMTRVCYIDDDTYIYGKRGSLSEKLANKFMEDSVLQIYGKGIELIKYTGDNFRTYFNYNRNKLYNLEISSKKKSITLSWAAHKWDHARRPTTGYQIQYSTSKKYKKCKTININNKKVGKKTIRKLKSKKKYYVRIRTKYIRYFSARKQKFIYGYGKWYNFKIKTK